MIKNGNLNYKISIINSEENKKYSNEYNVKSYPSFIFY